MLQVQSMPATATSTSGVEATETPAAPASAAGETQGETPASAAEAQNGTAEKASVGDIPGVGPSEV